MGLDFFSPPSNNPLPSFADDGKVQEIKEKLCKKRKDIELQSTTISPSLLEEYTASLIEIKKDMAIFGISEIDYQIYLVKQQGIPQ